MYETRTGRKTKGTLATDAKAVNPNAFRLGSALFDADSLRALRGIRYDVKNERLRIPKKAMPCFTEFAKVRTADVFDVLGQQNDFLLAEIADLLETIRDDFVMAAQAPLTPEKVLTTATVLFVNGVGFNRDWEKASFGRLELTVLPAATYKTTYMGKMFVGMVAGLTRLAGTVHFPGGVKVKMFPKFITHPFHQYGRSGC